MSDLMRVQPFSTQFRRILAEYAQNGSIFDIPRNLFYTPVPDARFSVPDLFGRFLAAPVGPSAGPHTQLSQNIVCAWLCGGRFIELKTVQVRDDLTIPRPCIDMTDEGYNVEWSQELRLEQSAHEYIVAWAILHLLPRLLGWTGSRIDARALPGVIFDMSVGYSLDSIRHPRMTAFMDLLADAAEPIADISAAVRRDFPGFADIEIPTSIATSATVSTMHGCPPEEIERIGRYLIEERGLHTVVKLNPTLLGRARVLEILHDCLGFTEIDIPQAVFDRDLTYGAAIQLIGSLRQVAAARGLTFGVKLSNTLAVRNHTGRLPGDEIYMSGRALYPLTMNLVAELLREFGGDLHVSYSGGADAWNVATILSAGALPVTGCTDLLKPGGYARLSQWLDTIDSAMRAQQATSLAELSRDRLANAARAASEALADPRYKKHAFAHGQPKVSSRLTFWDCIVAPCVEACAVRQEVPAYAWCVAQGDNDRALEIILARNPLPGVTGHVCTRLCETRCTRNDYEQTVAIRALKRAAEARGRAGYRSSRRQPTGHRVAIVGSGPSGLAAAAFLAVNGVGVVIFEARDAPGGMMRLVPRFRLPQQTIDRDIERIRALGVEIRLNTRVSVPPEQLLAQGFDAVYLASGFQRDAPLQVPGIEGPGVVPALQLLDCVRRGERVDLGQQVVVVGGGDTAMDAARTAQRLTRRAVTVVYRRTRNEMPAAAEEIEELLEEGNAIEELAAPVEVVRDSGRVTGLRAVRTRLGIPGSDGRPTPVPVPGSEFVIPCDAIVVAVGQLPELAFLDGSQVARHPRGGLLIDPATRSAGPAGVYAGGDVVIEPDSIISACADGRAAAEAICRRLGVPFAEPAARRPVLSPADVIQVKTMRARRIAQVAAVRVPAAERLDFQLIDPTFSAEQARQEARRCVQCAAVCDKCVEVCPNRANYTFRMAPVQWTLPLLTADGCSMRIVGTEEFSIAQPRQIVHVDDFCNECDNCQTFCVHQGKPYRDKPRLFLDADLFAAEADNAFRIESDRIRRRDGGEERVLIVHDEEMVFEDPAARLRLTRDWRITEIELTSGRPLDSTLSLRPAAEMRVLYEGVRATLPFLLLP